MYLNWSKNKEELGRIEPLRGGPSLLMEENAIRNRNIYLQRRSSMEQKSDVTSRHVEKIKGIFKKAGIPYKEVNFSPVSYTHLDVYKRQA